MTPLSRTPPEPEDAVRLAALQHYQILDTPAEAAFDRLARLAAAFFRAPIALVSLVDRDRQWFKACIGVDFRETDRSLSFCAHALHADDVLVVLDAIQDERFRDNILVTGATHIRFYAGAPLVSPEGIRLGTLCVLDTVPRDVFSAHDQAMLQDLAASVVSELELRVTLAERRRLEGIHGGMVEASPTAIVTLDAQGMITEWNPAAEQLFGYGREDVLGRHNQAVTRLTLGEEASRQFWQLIQAQATQEVRSDLAAPARHRDGHLVPTATTLLPIEVNGQRFYTLLIRDCTQEEAARAELIAQRNLLQTALNGVPEAMYVKDAQRRYLMINATGAAQLGQSAEAILGRMDEELLPQETAAVFQRWDEQVLQSGHRVGYETDDRMPGGHVRSFLTRKLAYRDSAGQVAGLVGISIDITERKAAEVAIQHYNTVLTQRVEDAQFEILQRLAQAAEYRDDDTGEHMTRVGEMAAGLAQELGLPEAEVELIRRTAPLHDVGKVGIPDGILLKPGRLTAEEFETVKGHSQIGAQILQGSRSNLVKMAETIAWTHHERWDGSGYPNRLNGLAIPLVGRIVAVADVLDALTSERPYKRAWTLEAALAEITALAGHQFDPQVVKALHRLLSKTEPTAGLDQDGQTEVEHTPEGCLG